MPVYLCQPGSGTAEPWRHGIQCFAAPFPLDEGASVAAGAGRDMVVLPVMSNDASHPLPNDESQTRNEEGHHSQAAGAGNAHLEGRTTDSSQIFTPAVSNQNETMAENLMSASCFSQFVLGCY